jgi:hypothetical protein
MVTRAPRIQRILQTAVGHVCCVALTFTTVCCAWTLFRAPSIADAGILFRRMFVPSGGLGTPQIAPSGLLYIYLFVVLCHFLASRPWFKTLRLRMPAYQLGITYCMMLLMALLLQPKSGQAFIYFQF